MARRDAKGYIRYSREELERIPSYEERASGRMAGLTGGTLGLLAGGTLGAAGGPGTALAGMAGGAVLGSQVARVAGTGAGQGSTAGETNQGSADGSGAETASPAPMTPLQARAGAQPLEDLSRELREDDDRVL